MLSVIHLSGPGPAYLMSPHIGDSTSSVLTSPTFHLQFFNYCTESSFWQTNSIHNLLPHLEVCFFSFPIYVFTTILVGIWVQTFRMSLIPSLFFLFFPSDPLLYLIYFSFLISFSDKISSPMELHTLVTV